MLKRDTFTKEVFWGFFEFTIILVAFKFFTHSIHEWIHLEVLQYFGGDGYIVKSLFGVGVHFTKLPTNTMATALAGGLGVALFYTLLMCLDWDDDPPAAAAFPPLILTQLTYGIIEGFYIFSMPVDDFNKITGIVWGISMVVGLLISIVLLILWLMRLNIKYSKK